MLYDSKWSEIFQEFSQCALKNESIQLQPFWKFECIHLTLWSAAARISAMPRKGFLLLQMLISCSLYGGNFWNFFYIFSNQCLTQSYSYMCPKKDFMKILLLVLEMVVLKCFWPKEITPCNLRYTRELRGYLMWGYLSSLLYFRWPYF